MVYHNDRSKPSRSALAELLSRFDVRTLRQDGFVEQFDVSEAFIFAHIHCLPSYLDLFAFMVDRAGFDRSRIVIIPKAYSTIPGAREDLSRGMGFEVLAWEAKLKLGHYDSYSDHALAKACVYADSLLRTHNGKKFRVVLLDDGGFLTEHWCRLGLVDRFDTVSVQQTTSGLFQTRYSHDRIVKINVAGSAAKRRFESKIIADAVTRKFIALTGQIAGRRIGIIGYGAIGEAVADAVSAQGANLVVYDRNPNVRSSRHSNANSLTELLNMADVVFGCTGRNAFERPETILEAIRMPQTFVSCSSRDVEFQSLLRIFRSAEDDDPFGDVKIGTDGVHTVLNGGFPINFDREREWEQADEISLTRALVLAGIYQALGDVRRHATGRNGLVPLGLATQKLVVDSWLRAVGKHNGEFHVSREEFGRDAWWQSESLNDPGRK